MKVVNREREVETLNREAVRLAKQVADETGTMLAGNICIPGSDDAKDPKGSSRLGARCTKSKCAGRKKARAESIIAETLDWFAEARIALEVIRSAGLPAVINLTTVMPKRSDGYDFDTACKELADNGALVVGLNCGRGPPTLLPILKKVIKAVGKSAHIAAIPVTYRTSSKNPGFFTLHHPGCRHGFPRESTRSSSPATRWRTSRSRLAISARENDLGVRSPAGHRSIIFEPWRRRSVARRRHRPTLPIPQAPRRHGRGKIRALQRPQALRAATQGHAGQGEGPALDSRQLMAHKGKASAANGSAGSHPGHHTGMAGE